MISQILTEAELQQVLGFLQVVRLDKGRQLFKRGDSAEGVYFLRQGKLGVQTETGFADRQQVVALLFPGAPVGEKGLTGTGTREMTVLAIEEDTELYYLDREDYLKLENSHPRIAIKLLKKLLAITGLRLKSSSERLAHVL